MDGGSLLVQGSPGVGKTHWVRELVKALRSNGKRVDIVAKTHASVSNFGEGAVTADHYVRRNIRSGGCVNCDVLICEEITQLEHQLWADFCKLALSGVSFILCGDFAQFSACCETHAGAVVPEGALERSHMITDLSGGNRLTLNENMRSDQILFVFYTSLAARPLDSALREARLRFPVTERPATTIVISHARRRYLNMRRNLAEKPPDAVFFRVHSSSKAGPQSMWLWQGLTVVGAGGAVKQGAFETVAHATPEEVLLHSGTRLTAHQAVRSLRLAYALTYPTTQGLTLPGVVRLDCTANSHFTWKHLYVGASRCTSHQLLEVV